MKDAESILSHIVSQPVYSRLREQACYRLIRQALPDSLQKGILFVFVKNRTLFFALKHPAFKMEFDYKLPTIKTLLTTIPPLREACKQHEIDRIRTFVSRYAPPPAPVSSSVPRYRERARADFLLKTEDPDIRRHFDTLRRLIARNRHDP